MYTVIAFGCAALVACLAYIWRNRHEGISRRMGRAFMRIGMLSMLGGVTTTFAFMSSAPLKEVEVWTTDIQDFRDEHAMTKFRFVNGEMKSAGEPTYEFSYETTAGEWKSVRVQAGKDTRVVEDDTLVCDEAKWKLYRVVVDSDWFFSGWLFSRDTMRVTHEFRVPPKVADSDSDAVN